MNTRTRLGGWLGSLAGFPHPAVCLLSCGVLAAGTAGAADRYWVGAAGASWSASASWSTNSGGTGGAGAPGTGDTAIFDGAVVNSAILDATYAGSVGAVDVRTGYTQTITQRRNLTVAEIQRKILNKIQL